MAGLNIAEWTPDQVADWISGLGPKVSHYAAGLRDRGLNGSKLLMLRCDDLEFLGMHIIGHQELLLEAVEQLRNFHYEIKRECVQQLAVKVSAAGASLSRALRHHTDSRLETSTLADVATTVKAVKPLACWLDRWVGSRACALWAHRDALLQLALEAATCAQRERFAEQPARAVAAAAAAAAAAADYIIQEVSDPLVLSPAVLAQVTLRAGAAGAGAGAAGAGAAGAGAGALGFSVAAMFCGQRCVARVRFGSPAHASGLLHDGDEILQVNGQCVIGWSGESVVAACGAGGGAGGVGGGAGGAGGGAGGRELTLRLRRRTLNTAPTHKLYIRGARAAPPRAASPASSASSDALSPPASPTHPAHNNRLFSAAPPRARVRRHSVCGAELAPHTNTIQQYWRSLVSSASAARPGSSCASHDAAALLYARDKSVSCSTGLQLSPRPRTVLGVTSPAPPGSPGPAPAAPPPPPPRARLDKSHSTPAYDFTSPPQPPAAPPPPTIPESPSHSPTILVHSADKTDTILHFKQSSTQIGEAILRNKRDDDHLHETINHCLIERRKSLLQEDSPKLPQEVPRKLLKRDTPPEPPPRPASTRPPLCDFPVLRPVPREPDTVDHRELSPLKPLRPSDGSQISLPLRHITKHDIQLVCSDRREMPAINGEPESLVEAKLSRRECEPAVGPSVQEAMLSPTSSVVRGIFPSSKSRSLKKKNSILQKRRQVGPTVLASDAAAASGAAWQRVRAGGGGGAGGGGAPAWLPRHLVLAHGALYAFPHQNSSRASCMIVLSGVTACEAREVRSRAHAFKVYHTGAAFYFACSSHELALQWLQHIQRAIARASRPETDLSVVFSETDYSDTESDVESSEKKSESKEKEKSKFGSLKKLTHRMQRCESQENVSHSSTSLDRKYLRFFSRHKKEDKNKNKHPVVVPTEHYRSYRRIPPSSPADKRLPPALAEAPPLSVAPHGPTSDSPLSAYDPRGSKKIPKPINYIHASNPNLLDFEKSDFVTKPALQPVKGRSQASDSLLGLQTLEQFMLQKQQEERQQPYTDRVLLGVQRGAGDAADLQKRLDSIVPDVIYGELSSYSSLSSASPSLPAPHARARVRRLPRAPPVEDNKGYGKPVSVTGSDGYEKIVYPEEQDAPPPAPQAASPPPSERWRDSLRRNDKVHSSNANTTEQAAPESWGEGGASVSRLRLMFTRQQEHESCSGAMYPHLQCPPTFQPETYSLTHSPQPRPLPLPRPAPHK